MSGITFGSGTFKKLAEPVPGFEIGTFEEEVDGAAVKALCNLAKAAAEATITINMLLRNNRLWWRMAYGRPQRWPVSNNWLKMHGYPMRRRGCR